MTTRDDAGAGLDACAELNDSDLGWMDALDGVGAEPAASNGDELRPPPAKKKKHAARRPARPLAPPGVSLAPEERARLEKERNREHARNTRARKKEALEKLRREVAGLEEAAVERDESERRARQIAKRRLAVLQCVFRKRGEGVLEREEWGKFLTSDFELRQPLNPHQACRPADVEGNRKLSRGVDGFIDDVASLSVLFRSVGRSADLSYRVAAAPTFACSVLPPAPTVVNDAVYGHWGARTTDARRHGARGEAGIRGLFCARFAESGCRLRSLELVYDVNALSEDIVRSTETPLTRVPGCLRDATFDADPAARVVTNRAKIKFCGASRRRRDACSNALYSLVDFSTGHQGDGAVPHRRLQPGLARAVLVPLQEFRRRPDAARHPGPAHGPRKSEAAPRGDHSGPRHRRDAAQLQRRRRDLHQLPARVPHLPGPGPGLQALALPGHPPGSDGGRVRRRRPIRDRIDGVPALRRHGPRAGGAGRLLVKISRPLEYNTK